MTIQFEYISIIFIIVESVKQYLFFAEAPPTGHWCSEGDFEIPMSSVCDGHPNCKDGSDEENCPHTCPEGKEIPANKKCDGIQDCSDASDEEGCPTGHL